MFQVTEQIIDAIRYINLPAFNKVNDEYVETTLPNKGQNLSLEEKEGFMQIGVTYTVRTKYVENTIKMQQLTSNVNTKIGGL